ncbi:hypothetical protein H114_24120 [Streptomyces gancidicus BKS 13-15]|uniref:Uncharacterized protein n=1 Tax=Streptomyces gancidicus BKS 13-15 TaxID=1284664 RepID=M3CQT9_STREZ|nr:hypothetical protein [Streptomyces gancidicus]EMF26423.1 hypothetical protein H114_24120 [Streptomyces gancidicus BKS 13-15]
MAEPEPEPGDLAPQWRDLSTNVYGILHAHGDAAPMAERFERQGWSSRSSSWYGYEVGTTWCELDLDPADSPDVLLNGVMDPSRFTDLAALLDRFGLSYTLELYDEEGDLLRETRG